MCVGDSPVRAQSTQPAGRSCHSMTATPRGVVLYGGAQFCGQALVNDSSFWTWNGSAWSKLHPDFPGRREDALLAYDSLRDLLVLYGGRAAGRVFTDTWELVSGRWIRREVPTSPGPLEHAAAAFDAKRGRFVVFGGANQATRARTADTWLWDGVKWEKRSISGPAARVGHSMTWSPLHDAVLLYGGFDENRSFRDLWKWDGEGWIRLDDSGPTETEGASLVASATGVTVLGTGSPGNPWDNNIRAWTFRDGRWTETATPPGPRGSVGAGVAFDATRQTIIQFGGAIPGGPPWGVVWELRDSWVRAR